MLTATTSQRNHSKSPIKDVLETVACRRSKILTGVSFYHQYNVPSLCAVLTCGSPSTVDWTGSQQIFTIGRLGFCLYSTYLRFQLGRLLCLFHNNRSAVGRSVLCTVYKNVVPTKLLIGTCLPHKNESTDGRPVICTVRTCGLRSAVDSDASNWCAGLLLGLLAPVVFTQLRQLADVAVAMATCAYDLRARSITTPPTPPSQPCVSPRLIRIL